MEKFKNVGLAVFAVAVLMLSGAYFSKSTVVEHLNTIEKAGSVASNIIDQNEVIINGVSVAYRSSGLQVATNTICVLKAPNATSSLKFASVSLTVSSSSASQVVFGKGTFQGATTTAMGGTFAIGANGVITVVASSSEVDTAANQPNYIFAPGTWLSVNMVPTGSGVGTESPTGSCRAIFNKVLQ